MVRPTSSSKDDQQRKYIAFQKAYQNIKSHREQGNHLAAYVVAFSVVEDRLRAMYVLWHRSAKGTEPSPKQVRGSISQHAKSLKSAGVITADFASSFQLEADRRNEIYHSAMWNLDRFTDEAVQEVIDLARIADKQLKIYKHKK